MARFLLAWEIGGGLGHLVPLAQVALPLVQRGHHVHFVLRDLSPARSALGALAASPQVQLWQAPIWQLPYQAQQPSASYAELLFHAGYLDAERLQVLVQGWQSLLDAIDPDLLLADHAPTALLAARGRPLRRAHIGSGFFQPPALQPLPSFREWEHIDAQRLAYTEARALATCNAVLAADGRSPLAALHELLAADEHFLPTWPELETYSPGPQGRSGARYWGPLPAREQGAPALWPAGGEPTLFAYLKGDYAPLETVLQQLAQAPCRTLAHVSGVCAAQRQRHPCPRWPACSAMPACASARWRWRTGIPRRATATSRSAWPNAALPWQRAQRRQEPAAEPRRVSCNGSATLLDPPRGAGWAQPGPVGTQYRSRA